MERSAGSVVVYSAPTARCTSVRSATRRWRFSSCALRIPHALSRSERGGIAPNLRTVGGNSPMSAWLWCEKHSIRTCR